MPEPREPRSIIEAAEQSAAAGDYASAERLLREAAVVQEATLGPLHPDLANTLNNLGVVCEMNDNPVDAEDCFRRAYAIATTALKPDHPFVATSRQNLRDFCAARGKAVDVPSHPEPPPVQPLMPRRLIRPLAIGGLGPAVMLIMILTAVRPWLNSNGRAEAPSPIATDSVRETPAPKPADYSNTKELGRLIYTDYVFPFEIAAVILLVAIVAAIALTLRARKDSRYQKPAEQIAVRREQRVRLVRMPSETPAKHDS